MPSPYNAKKLLLGVMFDAQKLIEKGETKKAVLIIEKKIMELKHAENCEYMRVNWK